jgi:hypothetical protein
MITKHGHTRPLPPKEATHQPQTLSGVMLGQPREKHTHSYWNALKTETGAVVRVCLPFDQPATPHAIRGATVRLTGQWRVKVWWDGEYPTFSGYLNVEILVPPPASPAKPAVPAEACRPQRPHQPVAAVAREALAAKLAAKGFHVKVGKR